jgi:nitrogen fixation protein FixH
VSINNIDAPVADGKYSANVTLKEGKNVINIVAKSGQAAPEETVTVTYKK